MVGQCHHRPEMDHYRSAETQKAQERAALVAYIFLDVLPLGSPGPYSVLMNDNGKNITKGTHLFAKAAEGAGGGVLPEETLE